MLGGSALEGVRLRAQEFFTRVGARLEPGHIRFLNATVNYLEVGRWLKVRGYGSSPRVRTRADLHLWLAGRFARERVLYLEFGVYRGASLRRWAGGLANPASQLHGFDSFQGLPEDWDVVRKKGAFTTNGQLPQFQDPRVFLHVGLFSETLPKFAPPDHQRMIVNIDADLYSSADFVLRDLQSKIRSGTVLLFDEFCDRWHEMRAFEEYLARSGAGFKFLCGTANLGAVAFECTGMQ